MKKSWISLTLAALLLLSSVSCGQNDPTDATTTDDGVLTTIRPDTTAADTASQDTDGEETTAVPETEPVTEAATDPETTSEPETEAPTPTITLTVDETYAIVLEEDADELTRSAAERMAAAFKEGAGLDLSIVTEGQSEHGICLAIVPSQEGRDHELYLSETGFLYLTATDSTALYFAAEAIMEAWLDPAANCVGEDGVYLDDLLAADLAAVTTRLDTSIRILTQNMRGSDDPNGNTVQKRSARFIQMIDEYQPDLIGTQEYSYNWEIWLKRHEKSAGGSEETRIYGQVGISNNGPTSKQGGMNAILYRLDRFELLDSNTFWLSDTPERPSTVSGTNDKRICTWVKLRDKLTDEVFVFANTHLDHQDMERRYIQANILLEQLAPIVGDLPLYLTGDFNTGNRSTVYDFMTMHLQDAHKTAWVDAGENWGTYHAYEQYGSEIDFIFHGDHAVPVRYEIVTKQYDGYISDHYGVIADFVSAVPD